MKITGAEAIHLRQGDAYSVGKDGGESGGVENVCLIRIDTDEGITGWADVETQPHIARAVMDAPDQFAFRGIRHCIVGENPLEVDRLWDRMFRDTIYVRGGVVTHVMSGVINACYDVMGKALGKPVCELLGGKNRDKVRAYASTLFRDSPQQMQEAVRGYRERGFTAIKFGWGVFRDDMGLDVELVAAARDAAGPDVDIMVDSGWTKPGITVANTLELARRLVPLNVVWIEDCLNPENYEGYRTLCSESPVPIAAGEQESGLAGFARLIDTGIGFAQPDLSRCGGLSVARNIAAYAGMRQVQVVPHAWLTDLLTSASLHFNAWLPHAAYLEFNVSKGPLARSLCEQPIVMDSDGFLGIPTGPGLGVEIDEEAVARFRVGP